MDDKSTNWPTASILFWGSFGAKTPAGRRFHNHFKFWLVLMAMGFLFSLILSTDSGRMLGALLPGIAFTGIAWDFRRYLLSLDELARRIQVESIAWTYLTGLAVAPLIGGVLVAFNLHPSLRILFGEGMVIPPAASQTVGFFLYILLIEQVRTIWLYVVSRRY